MPLVKLSSAGVICRFQLKKQVRGLNLLIKSVRDRRVGLATLLGWSSNLCVCLPLPLSPLFRMLNCEKIINWREKRRNAIRHFRLCLTKINVVVWINLEARM